MESERALNEILVQFHETVGMLRSAVETLNQGLDKIVGLQTHISQEHDLTRRTVMAVKGRERWLLGLLTVLCIGLLALAGVKMFYNPATNAISAAPIGAAAAMPPEENENETVIDLADPWSIAGPADDVGLRLHEGSDGPRR